MVMIALYARQQKRHRCIEQSFGLCGRGRGWDDLGEWHWNMYIITCEMNRQSRLDAWDRVLGAGALGWPRGMGWWEMGGGFRMGNTCIAIADSCLCMEKALQYFKVIQFSSVTQLCLTLCDPMNCSTPGLPVHHQLPEFTHTHIHRVGDAIQPSHPLSSPSPPALNPSIRVFSNESTLYMRWPKYWSFSFSINSN